MSNILNQDEIDSLLGAMERGEIDESAGDAGDINIREYNFRRPNLITREQLRSFETVHENFSRELISNLALLLRTNVDFNLVSTEQQQYNEFVNSLPKISHCIVFSADPLPGLAVAEINLSLVFAIVDILLGGEGDIETEIRIPTDIEVSILSPFIERMLLQLQQSWSSVFNVSFGEERSESDPEYIQIAPPDAPVIVLAFDTKINMINGIINICYPLPMIQAVNEYLDDSSLSTETYIPKAGQEKAKEWLVDSVLEIPLPISIELGKARIKGRDLMGLKPGDIIVLDRSVSDTLPLSISSRETFNSRPGKIKQQICAKICNRIMTQTGRSQSLAQWLDQEDVDIEQTGV